MSEQRRRLGWKERRRRGGGEAMNKVYLTNGRGS